MPEVAYKMFKLHQPGLNRTSMEPKGKPWAQWAAKWETSWLHTIGPFTQPVQGRTVVPLLRLASLHKHYRGRMGRSKSFLLWASSRGIMNQHLYKRSELARRNNRTELWPFVNMLCVRPTAGRLESSYWQVAANSKNKSNWICLQDNARSGGSLLLWAENVQKREGKRMLVSFYFIVF